jgi:biopolymer transport protein TolQ
MFLVSLAQVTEEAAQALAEPVVAPETGPGILEFFFEAGPMAKLVLATLVGFSVLSWAIMIAKGLQLRRSRRQSTHFLQIFRRSSRFSEVESAARRLDGSPMVGIFRAGYAEIDAQIKAAPTTAHGTAPSYKIRSLSSLERTLERAVRVEGAVAARWVSFLATTAAATPFIGLFGTVWGIMVAFRDIGVTGSTSIVTVAPGIAEALINTAAGLGAAIPALIGYNFFAARLRQTRGQLEDFALEFLNLSERNFT